MGEPLHGRRVAPYPSGLALNCVDTQSGIITEEHLGSLRLVYRVTRDNGSRGSAGRVTALPELDLLMVNFLRLAAGSSLGHLARLFVGSYIVIVVAPVCSQRAILEGQHAADGAV